jgi:hypothetical protein
MMVRAALLSLLLAVGAVAPALAQDSGPTGSLTLMSRPAGASFRIEGDVTVVGRTPMTFDRGLSGRYHIVGYEIGYDRWSRTVMLDGVSADTVWFTLGQKNAFMAGARSLILPGWGQIYDEHPVRATLFMLSAVGAGVGVGIAQWRYRDRKDDYAAAVGTTNEAHAAARLDHARQFRLIMLGALGGVVGVSVIDAAASVPRPVGTILLGQAAGSGQGRLGALPAAGMEYGVVLASRRF